MVSAYVLAALMALFRGVGHSPDEDPQEVIAAVTHWVPLAFRQDVVGVVRARSVKSSAKTFFGMQFAP
jgi:hypothetical protein